MNDLTLRTAKTMKAKGRSARSPFAGARSLIGLLTAKERRQGLLLLVVAVVMALVETMGVASAMPFLAVLGNPKIVDTNALLSRAYHFGDFTNREDFLFALGTLTLIIVVSAAIFRAAAQYFVFRFVNMRRHSISMRLFIAYLHQPFSFYLNRNSADLSKRTLSDVDQIIDNVLLPIVQLVAYGIVVISLLVLLVVVDPSVASTVLILVCGFYTIIYVAVRRVLLRTGRDRNLANRQRFTEAGEAFGGIKEIKLLGREEAFIARFDDPTFRFALHRATSESIVQVPRYLIEAIAFGGILALALFLMKVRGDLGSVLPVLGLYAFAGYRLLPAMQQVYTGITRLRFGLPMVQSVVEDLTSLEATRKSEPQNTELSFRNNIRFERVTYRYSRAVRPAVDSVDLEITANTTVGFVGKTGAGKTTAVDLLLGLLDPSEGSIVVDSERISESNRRSWQRHIGYVPQAIFLADASVAENIAFGIARNDIDRAAVERAARIANIHDFVTRELANGYDTDIGERGIRLSGGQRQRIGIARALYNNPAILVFDEATSALDNATEAAVMDAITELQHNKTIIIVAHRLTTVQNCDTIFEFDSGKVRILSHASKLDAMTFQANLVDHSHATST